MYLRRDVESLIQEASQSFPCLVVYGPRQVGKSTTVYQLFGQSMRMVTLDDLDDLALAQANPKLFLDSYAWPLVIDEIQKAPALLQEIKRRIDAQRLQWLQSGEPRQLMYVLTGSNRFELQEGISESLAGRCGIIEMYSLSQAEKQQVQGHPFTPDPCQLLAREAEGKVPYHTRDEIFSDIFQGGMPDICTGQSERDIYFRSYIATYIERDVRKLISASSETAFRNFISLVALRTGSELHYDELASSAGIDVKTCKRWLSILETSGLVVLLQPFMANLSNRIIKAPKLYMMDTGLCAALCGWPNAEMLQKGALGGAMFETYVVSELIKNLSAFGMEPKQHLYYYRDIDQREIDLIYAEADVITPIEIKKGIAPKKPARHFAVLDKFHMPVNKGLVVDCCDKIRPLNENVYSYPVHLLGM